MRQKIGWVGLVVMVLSHGVAHAASTTALQVSAGDFSTCAVMSDHSVQCWGGNSYGELGNGTTTSSSTPVAVTGITTAQTVVVGSSTACALLTDHSVQCWGYNIYGSLGNGTTTNSSIPVTVPNISASAISIGGRRVCVTAQGDNTIAKGAIQCWGGYNKGGLTPVLLPGTHDGISIGVGDAGGNGFGCTSTTNGTVWCWGYNSHGELGNGTAYWNSGDSLALAKVLDITTATAVSAADYESCALLKDGTIKCWGYYVSGPGGAQKNPTPVTMTGIPTATAVSVGTFGSCALLKDGTIRCWGEDSLGGLGNGTTIDAKVTDIYTPVTVTGIATAIAISSGYSHTCAVLTGGAVQCWGQNNYGKLGDGTTTDRSTPVTVFAGSSIKPAVGGRVLPTACPAGQASVTLVATSDASTSGNKADSGLSVGVSASIKQSVAQGGSTTTSTTTTTTTQKCVTATDPDSSGNCLSTQILTSVQICVASTLTGSTSGGTNSAATTTMGAATTKDDLEGDKATAVVSSLGGSTYNPCPSGQDMQTAKKCVAGAAAAADGTCPTGFQAASAGMCVQTNNDTTPPPAPETPAAGASGGCSLIR